MKKIFTLILVFASAFALLAQNPYVNSARTGLANSFDTEADVLNEFMAWSHWFNGFAENTDTSEISWVDGAMKLEAKQGWDYAKAYFLISPDLTETIDITNKYRVSFKYKNLAPADIALAVSFRNIVGEDSLAYGGEIWLEGGDVTYESDEWATVDMEFTLEDFDLEKVTALEIYVDGQPNGSVIIDDVVFGDIDVTDVIDAFSETDIQVYPNPASDYLRIRNAGQVFDVAIFNITGQHLLSVQNKEQIDISSLKSGLYFVRVSANDVSDTFKVLVK